MDGFDPEQAMQALLGAAPQELDAHRNLLSEAFQMLEGQGVDTSDLAAQAGSSTDDPGEMSHSDLLSTTMALAQQHPEIMQMVAQRFPEAQGLLGTVLGSGGAQGGGGGFLGGLLGRL
jgi:hypothetical protein